MTTPNTIKQLNEPQPVEVKRGEHGTPVSVRLKPVDAQTIHPGNRRRRNSHRQQYRAIRSDGKWMNVVAIEDTWKINDEWWRGSELEIERVYFDVVLENNQRLTIFRDLIRDTWSRQAE